MQARDIAVALFAAATVGAASAQSICNSPRGSAEQQRCLANQDYVSRGLACLAFERVVRLPGGKQVCERIIPSLDHQVPELPQAPGIRNPSNQQSSRQTDQSDYWRQQDKAAAQARAREDAEYAAEKARQRAASEKRQRDYEEGQRQFAEEAARQKVQDDAAYAAEKARQRAASEQRYRAYEEGQRQFAEEAARQKAQDDAEYAAEKARQRAASEQRYRAYEEGQRQFAEEAARQQAEYYRSPGGCTGCSPEYRQSQGLSPYARPQPQPEPYPGYYNSPGGCTGCSPEYRQSIGLPPYPQR